MPARKSTAKSTVAHKRLKTAPADASASVSFASSKLISREAMAATRLQRVWKLKFSLRLTHQIVVAYLKPGAAPTPDYTRSIR